MCCCGTKNTAKTAGSVTDVVCGMQIDPESAAGKTEYQGTTYYFCGTCCKGSFDSNPAQYAQALVSNGN